MRNFTTTVACVICTTEFIRKNSRSKYCSDACSREGERRVTNDYQRAYRQRKPEPLLQKQARKAVEVALRPWNCKLERPGTCELCNKSCKPEAHHYLGYEQEHWLDVLWLCKSCHDLAHDKREAA